MSYPEFYHLPLPLLLSLVVMLLLIVFGVLIVGVGTAILKGKAPAFRHGPLAVLATIVFGSVALVLLGVALYDGASTSDKLVAIGVLSALGIGVLLYSIRGTRSAASRNRDVFICHVSEDRESIARPIAAALAKRGIDFWLDEAEMRWGDRIREKIEKGLGSCRYVLVLVTRNFINKESRWTKIEVLRSLSVELMLDRTTVLPLVSDADWEELVPSLGALVEGKHVVRWCGNADNVARELVQLMTDQTIVEDEEVATSADRDSRGG